MKLIHIILAALLFFIMLLLPITAIRPENDGKQNTTAATVSANAANGASFKILLSESGKTVKIPVNEYIFGVVAAEMPALYEPEALKAQAVAAYTYASYRKQNSADTKYDLSDSGSDGQCYISREKAKEKWGDNAEKYEKKIDEAVTAVLGQAILYNGKPILAAYHAVSSGKTESGSELWGGELPYLVSVDSVNDLLSPDYLETKEYASADLQKLFTDAKIEISGEPTAWFSGESRTSVGSIKKINVCGKEISGEKLRNILNLKSADIEISLEGDKFTFTTKGYGHGVGMSQYSANQMALQGSGYKEILSAFYTGCTLGIIKN